MPSHFGERFGHYGERLGVASSFLLTTDGVWCAIEVGRRGEQILGRGLGVSAEVLDGEITHVALGGGSPAFASASAAIVGTTRTTRRPPATWGSASSSARQMRPCFGSY